MVDVIVGAIVGVSGCMCNGFGGEKGTLIDKAKLSKRQCLFHPQNCIFLFSIDLLGLENQFDWLFLNKKA
jgi:hypothetical protein